MQPLIRQVYGDDALGRSAVFKWHQRFSQGRDSLEDDQRKGRPPTVRTERKIEEVATVVRANRSQSVDDIAAAVGVSHDKEARSKWQNLRSNYMRERRKIRRLPRGVNLKNVITWPYYNMLSFLGSVIRQKKGGNDSDIDSSFDLEEESQHYRDETAEDEFETKYNIRNSDDLNDANATDEGNGKTANSESFTGSSILRKRKRANNLGEDNTHKLYLKRLEKLAAREEEDNDPDLMFLRSLLPSIKRLGPLENLEFRGEVIQLLKQKLTPPTPVVCYSNPSSVGSDYEQTVNN
ncbi:hypothetical protein C0J52_12211 [Blattella germanica]|nr:hypothetical protein C0J52_12211 [Blattella germanica]